MNLPQPRSIQGPLAERLAHYVYLLIDPRDGVIFYVGKGKDDRCLQRGHSSINRYRRLFVGQFATSPDQLLGAG